MTRYKQEGLTAILRYHDLKWCEPMECPSIDEWEVFEWLVYHLKIVATSEDEALQKAEAFYAQQRKPKPEYHLEGLTVTVEKEWVDFSRPASSPSAWANVRAVDPWRFC